MSHSETMRVPPLIAALFVLACGVAFGQTADTKARFEAASVRPAAPSANGRGGSFTLGGPGTPDPERISYTNVPLKSVLTIAYDVQSDQVSGPSWLDSGRFDITATIPKGATKDQFRLMLQNLLTERFHLMLHHERKDFPVYILLVAKSGPKFRAVGKVADSETTRSVPPDGSADKDGFPRPCAHCVAQIAPNGVAKMAGNQITMAAFAQFLRHPVGVLTATDNGMGVGRVADKTGLTAEYDIRLEYQWPGPRSAPVDGQNMAGVADNPDLAPNLFTALSQQLGLRLEQAKVPLDVLVVDSVEKVPVKN